MDTLRRFFSSATSWYLIGYLFLIAGGAFLFTRAANDRAALRQEIVERQTFDDRRQYDICVGGNESRKAIRDAFDAYTDALVAAASQEEMTPKEKAEMAQQLATFQRLIDEKLKPLEPRDCRELLKLSQDQP